MAVVVLTYLRIPKLVDMLCNVNGYGGYISGFVTLNEEDCTKIYQAMV